MSSNSRSVRLCLGSDPLESEIVQIRTLDYELKDSEDSETLVVQAAVRFGEGQQEPGGGVTNVLPGQSQRYQNVRTTLKQDFFDRNDFGGKLLRAVGIVVVGSTASGLDGSSRALQGETVFDVTVTIPTSSVSNPTKSPSASPSASPQALPSIVSSVCCVVLFCVVSFCTAFCLVQQHLLLWSLISDVFTCRDAFRFCSLPRRARAPLLLAARRRRPRR